MSKELGKDFRQAVKEVVIFASYDTVDQATDRILALCKEMLVPEDKPHVCILTKTGEEGRAPTDWEKKGWNSARQHILKQLGEAGS